MGLDPRRVLSGTKSEMARKAEGRRHPDGNALAVNQPSRIVARQALKRVTEGVTEIEQRTLSLLGLVGCDDAGFGRTTGCNGLGAGRAAREHFAPTSFEKFEEIAVADEAILDDFRVPGAKLAPAQGIEAARICENEHRLVERADEILAVRRIDPRLSADAGIDLRQERGGDLNEAHPSAEGSRAE